MGGGGDEQQISSGTSTSEPWEAQQPFLEQGFRRSLRDVLRSPDQYFPGDTFVPFSPETEFGIAAQTGRALGGNPLNPMSQQQAMATMGGGYLGQGPAWDAMTDAVTSAVVPQVDSEFGAGRRFGSPLHAEAVSRGVSRGLAPVLDAERDRMLQATALAPSLANQDYHDIQQLMGAGAMREDLFGRQLQDQINRWNFAMQEPEQRIANYMSLIRGGFGGTTENTQMVEGGGGGGPGMAQAGVGAAMSILPIMAMMFMSDRNMKDDIEPAGPMLPLVEEVPVSTWRYKGDDQRHVGPMAQDIQETLGLSDGHVLSGQDLIGVLWKAIQELSARVKELEDASV